MAEDRFLVALTDSIDRLAAGQSIEDCMEVHPEYADQLRLYLSLGQLTRRARIPDAEVELVRTRIRANIDAAFGEWGTGSATRFPPWILLLILVVAIPLVLLVGGNIIGGGTASTPEPPTEGVEVTAELVPPVTVDRTPTLAAPSFIPKWLKPTLTATSSPTNTPTQTVTATSSPTNTPTQTVTVTNSPTNTPTQTVTATNSPTTTPTDAACIPAAPEGWVSYRVQGGDTLSGLAAATGTTLEQVTAVNCIEDARFIVVGQAIFLPAQPSATQGGSKPGEAQPTDSSPGGSDPVQGASPPSSDGGSSNSNDNDDDDVDDDDD